MGKKGPGSSSLPSAPHVQAHEYTTSTRRAHMKVLFLDVDGVITVPDGTGRLDEAKLRRIENGIQQTGCQICISSNCGVCFASLNTG